MGLSDGSSPGVVLLDGHDVGRAPRDHPLQRLPQVPRSRRARLVRVVGEDLEQTPSDDLLPNGVRRPQVGVGRAEDGEALIIGQQEQ